MSFSKKQILVIGLAAFYGLSACSAAQNARESTPTSYPTPIRTTFTVQRGDMVSEAKLTGRVLPLASETVKFQMQGHVSDVFVQLNDMVEEGQLE